MSELRRRKGDLRPDTVNINDLLEAYGKTVEDVYDFIFQLFFRDVKVIDKRLTDTHTSIEIKEDGNVIINWLNTDFENIKEATYRLAIGVKFDSNSEEQNPDQYTLNKENGKDLLLGYEPEYIIISKSTQ